MFGSRGHASSLRSGLLLNFAGRWKHCQRRRYGTLFPFGKSIKLIVVAVIAIAILISGDDISSVSRCHERRHSQLISATYSMPTQSSPLLSKVTAGVAVCRRRFVVNSRCWDATVIVAKAKSAGYLPSTRQI